MCTSGIGPCQLPADADGKPLRPAILYGVDTRSYKEVAGLTGRYGDDAVVQRCGQLADVPVAGRLYDDLFAHYLDLYPATTDIQHDLAGMP